MHLTLHHGLEIESVCSTSANTLRCIWLHSAFLTILSVVDLRSARGVHEECTRNADGMVDSGGIFSDLWLVDEAEDGLAVAGEFRESLD
jgi:hypothetical protein